MTVGGRASRGAFLGALAGLVLATSVAASELHVEPRSLRVNDLTTIVVTLEGDFAAADSVDIPLQNLVLTGDPSVSSEFAWINGQVSRRKTFRYRARPLQVGPARVGPLTLTAGGPRETLAAVAVQVVADRASESNDAEAVLRELLATGREPLFLIAEADRRSVRVGEPVVVTWVLFNATDVQEWRVVAVPDLTDFWSEELKRTETIETAWVGGRTMQRLPVRRVALFPLRTGRLRIDGVTIDAAVLRARRGGPLAMFEGDLEEVTFTAAPLEIDVGPIPPGPPVDAVGTLEVECTTPAQRAGGPVTFDIVLHGKGNLRAAKPPRFDGAFAGTWKVEGGDVTLPRDEGSLEMSRRWRYLLFPSRAGLLEVPPLSMRIFDSAAATRRELRCAGRVLEASVATPELPAAEGGGAPAAPRRLPWNVIGALAALAAFVLLAFRPLRREWRLRREVRAIVEGATPETIRDRVDAALGGDPAARLAEPSDRGDAYRALRSLLDAAARDRDVAVGAEREIRRRVREVLSSG